MAIKKVYPEVKSARRPPVDDTLRQRHRIVRETIVLEVDLRQTLLQPLHKGVHGAQPVPVLRAVSEPSERHRAVVEQEADERALGAGRAGGAGHDLRDKVGSERDDLG